jgi:hypothetical protein
MVFLLPSGISGTKNREGEPQITVSGPNFFATLADLLVDAHTQAVHAKFLGCVQRRALTAERVKHPVQELLAELHRDPRDCETEQF